MEYKLTDQQLQEAVDDLKTISDFIRWTASCFETANLFFGHGTNNSWNEAMRLILDSLKIPKETASEIFNCRLTKTERDLLAVHISERVRDKKPLPYITNVASFAGYEFFVDERVLIPRSPIGELVNNRFEPWLLHQPQSILDLCTGGGCIALSCAMTFPEAKVVGSDISEDAIDVAKINSKRYSLDESVELIKSDLFDQLQARTFDLIVCNPPYVDAEDMEYLPKEYQHEPKLALASGMDGLDITRKILEQAASHLNAGGLLIVEVGNSAEALVLAYPNLAFTWFEFENGGDGVFMLEKSQLTPS